jgi:hypothetical protein
MIRLFFSLQLHYAPEANGIRFAPTTVLGQVRDSQSSIQDLRIERTFPASVE